MHLVILCVTDLSPGHLAIQTAVHRDLGLPTSRKERKNCSKGALTSHLCCLNICCTRCCSLTVMKDWPHIQLVPLLFCTGQVEYSCIGVYIKGWNQTWSLVLLNLETWIQLKCFICSPQCPTVHCAPVSCLMESSDSPHQTTRKCYITV